MARGFLLGICFTIVVALLAGYYGVRKGWLPAGADQPPGKVETWAAKTSLHAAIARDAQKLSPPIPADEANLLAGLEVYAQDCAVCHGAADARPSAIASGLNIRAPQLAHHGVEDDPVGVTYWKVRHGIRFTGMPAFGKSLDETKLWQVSLFLQKMDALPPAVASAWNALPSAAGAVAH